MNNNFVFPNTDFKTAKNLDRLDELARYRQEFFQDDPDLIYLDGNSLGRLPFRTLTLINQTIENEWGSQLIRSWNRGWIELPRRLGGKISSLVGAHPDEVLVSESTSTNLFKLTLAALSERPGRKRIISDVLNFPSDLYILQGIIKLLNQGHELVLIPSRDGITIKTEDLFAEIDANTALVCLTHVAFKSAFMFDMATISQKAHENGALVLWDLSHSVGAVPIELNKCEADLAVGCTYKYLNGGPGAPAFLFVRRDLQSRFLQPVWGWFASKTPFDFELDFTPAPDLARFQVSSPPILSMKAIEPALDILLEAGIERLYKKSQQASEYLIYLADQWLVPLGFELGSPRNVELRGSHISLRHPESFRIARAMIEATPPAVKVIPDFRVPDNIRLGITPIYTSFVDIYRGVDRMRAIVEQRTYEQYSNERMTVT